MSTYPVTCEFLDDIRVHRLGIGYIQIALGNRAIPLLGEAAPVERGGQPRIDLQGGIEIDDGVSGRPALQVDQAAAVQRVDEVRTQPKRFVAILERRLQVADHATGPTAVVEGFHVPGIDPDRVVKILYRKAIGPLAGRDLAA